VVRAGCIPWAAAAVSKACFDAGFNDGAGHWAMPGIAARTEHGFAWVGDLRRAFEAAGRFDASPRRGDIAIVGGDRHACLVEAVRVDGIVRTIEGDYHDDCVRNARTMQSVDGFCHCIPVEGVYGAQTQRVVDEFQHQKHLDNDGIVGPRTWEAAWRAAVT
jgi:peptidoglycan hydrolase-like protein with peptidoglycan-binding domain